MIRSVFFISALFIVACRPPSSIDGTAAKAAPLPTQSLSGSSLGNGDLLEVHVFQEPDFSGPFRVQADGTIAYPFCHELKVVGLEPGQIAEKITGCISPRVLKNPQIDVSVREYNSKKIFVLGEVTKPGPLPFTDNMGLIEAISDVGGLTKTASRNSVTITRLVDGKEQRLKAIFDDIEVGKAPDVSLQPGDIIFVPESFL